MIKFSLSLSKKGNLETSRHQIVDFFIKHGIENTGGGRVTLSFVATQETFDEVFQSSMRELPDTMPRPVGTVGASAPFEEPMVKVPEKLDAFVEFVSIAPPAQTFFENN